MKKYAFVLTLSLIITMITSCSIISYDPSNETAVQTENSDFPSAKQTNSAVSSENQVDFSQPLTTTYDFKGYEELIAFFTPDDNISTQKVSAFSTSKMYGKEYTALVDSIADQTTRLAIPVYSGLPAPLRDLDGYFKILMSPKSLYDETWFWFYCVLDGHSVTIRMMYLDEIQKEYALTHSIFELREYLNQNAEQKANETHSGDYNEINYTLKLADKDVESVRRIYAEGHGRDSIMFVYNDLYITILCTSDAIESGVISKLSFASDNVS